MTADARARRRACACCARTARSRATTTRSSARRPAWTRCRPPCCASSCGASTTATTTAAGSARALRDGPRGHERRAAGARVADDGDHVYHLFIVRTDAARRAARAPGRARRLDRGPLPVPDPPHRGLRGSRPRPGSLPVAERLAEEICTLPLFPTMSDDDVARVIDAVATSTGRHLTQREHRLVEPATSADAIARPLRVAVVGYGYWGPNLVRNVIERPELELAGALRARRRSAARVLARAYPGVPVIADLDEVLADPTHRRGPRRHAAAHPPRDRLGRACAPASTCSSRSRWPRPRPRRAT